MPADARLITTKLVSGVASRYPPVDGWMSRSKPQRAGCQTVRAQPQSRIRGRAVMMANLADRDQRRQRIADHRQPQPAEQLMRERGQFERQLRDRRARHHARSELPGDRHDGEDRHGERAVVAVAAQDGLDQASGFEAARPRAAATLPRVRPSSA